MIRICLRLSNPFSKCKWGNLSARAGTLSSYKAWELNRYISASIASFEFDVTARNDHAGIRISIGLLGREIEGYIYDTRHWNYNTGNWDNTTAKK